MRYCDAYDKKKQWVKIDWFFLEEHKLQMPQSHFWLDFIFKIVIKSYKTAERGRRTAIHSAV